MKVLFEHHHQQLSQSLIYLFEKRLGMELYRPSGDDWYTQGFYHHPLPDEAHANLTPADNAILTPPAPNEHDWRKGGDVPYFDQDNTKFRWLPLDRANEIDYFVVTSDRNQHGFQNLRNKLGTKAKVIRYCGNAVEGCDTNSFDIGLFATKNIYEELKGSKPCVLYRPEFDLKLYNYQPPPDLAWGFIYAVGRLEQPTKDAPNIPIIRNFLNFTYHHREAGSPWETWKRYEGYGNEIGAKSILHGLGTPPPGIETELDVILDTAFDRMGRPELKDRKNWPDLKFNRGEPQSHKQIAELIHFSNLAVHIKRSPPEGYGFTLHCLAACGRPMVIEQDAYRHLSASVFLQHKETCLFVNGLDLEDKKNYRWALEPENNERMSSTLYQRFQENVSFENEAKEIAKLL